MQLSSAAAAASAATVEVVSLAEGSAAELASAELLSTAELVGRLSLADISMTARFDAAAVLRARLLAKQLSMLELVELPLLGNIAALMKSTETRLQYEAIYLAALIINDQPMSELEREEWHEIVVASVECLSSSSTELQQQAVWIMAKAASLSSVG